MTAKRSEVVIEIMSGSPDSGKTVLARAIADFLNERGISCLVRSAEQDVALKTPEMLDEIKDRLTVEIRDVNRRPPALKASVDGIPADVLAIVDAGRGEVTGQLQVDDHGVVTASLPLPGDHWLYDRSLKWTVTPIHIFFPLPRWALESEITRAAQRAIQGATLFGKSKDFDPDALIQNLLVNLLGERPLKETGHA